MPMLYFISTISFLFLFYVVTATASTADDDDVFLAFVKGEPNFEKFCKELEENGKLENIRKLENDKMQSLNTLDQKKDFLIQMYEAHLGGMYLMREHWNCDKISEKIEHERKECEKLRKYLDILYEYLFRVYLEAADQTLSQQLPAVKPQFEFYLRSEYNPSNTLTQIVKGLIKIFCFFFDQYTSSHKVNEMFNKAPKISNEGELNYELNDTNANGGTLRKLDQKMKQENEAKENAIGIFREQFEKKLKQMLMNTKQNEAAEMGVLNFLEGQPRNYYKYQKNFLRIKNREHDAKFYIFFRSQFDGTIISSVDEDVLFLAFVKDQSNFGRFCQEKENDLQYVDYGPTYGFTFDQKKEHLMQKYEANLGVLYLMRENWKCDNIVKKPELEQKETENEKTECEKFGKYLNILYEYLFRVHLEAAAGQKLSKQLPAVKPQFEFYLHSEIPLKTLIQIVKGFKISNFFFAKQTKLSNEGDDDNGPFSEQNEAKEKAKLSEMFTYVNKPKLLNEEELNYKLMPANANAIRELLKTKISKSESAIGTFREQFDKKLEQMLTNTKQNEAKEKAKLKSEKKQMSSMRREVKKEEINLINEFSRKQARCPLDLVEKVNAFWEIFPNCLTVMDEKMKQANKQMANSDKFDIFLNSPFYDKVCQ